MIEKEVLETIDAWRRNTDPSSKGCKKCNNALLSFKIHNLDLTIEGIVIWDEEAGEYVFHFHEHHSPSQTLGIQRVLAMYDRNVHQYIMDTLSVHFGIFRTEGMYIIPEHSSFFCNQTDRVV